jgi:hypothetical protein
MPPKSDSPMNPEGDSGAAEQQHLDFCSKSDCQQGVPTNSLRQGLRFRWNPDTRKESMAHGKEAQRDLERNPSTDCRFPNTRQTPRSARLLFLFVTRT